MYTLNLIDWFVQDASVVLSPDERGRGKHKILERYFNDLYKIFLNKLTSFDVNPGVDEVEKEKLKSMLQELIHVKELLEDTK